MTIKKLTFQEAWDSSTIFFVDDELEDEIDERAAKLLRLSKSPHLSSTKERKLNEVIAFLKNDSDGLDVILRDIGLSDEKFMRIVSLLRKIGRISGGFTSEWTMRRVKGLLGSDSVFLELIARLLFNGKQDQELQLYIPRYYLTKLTYQEIGIIPAALREVRYKEALIGTYGGKKGYKVEARIKESLEKIKVKYGIGYEQGKSRIVNVDLDFAIPTLQDPWIIIMSSFQETTSSGQTTKVRDMLAAYTIVEQSNSRHNENRAFVNFVDGGGWLARKRDMERLVNQCHYFVNLQNLDMLESIVLEHVPETYLIK